jgi:AraC-like DNA-binding protein
MEPSSVVVDRLTDPHFQNCPLGSILVTGCNYAARKPITSMRALGRYALAYVMEGRGKYVDEAGCRCALSAGDLILVFPDLAHRYGPAPLWSEQFIVFDGPIFRAWESAGILDRSHPVVRLGTSTNWLERILWVTAAGVPTNESAALRELCRLQDLLAEMLAGNPTWQRGSKDNFIEQARATLEQMTPSQRGLPAIADDFGMSQSTFRRKFRDAVGMSPNQYRLQSMIRHAQTLMLEAELSDKQIASKLGFSDPSHLSRRFKQQVGLSPRQYRRTCERNEGTNGIISTTIRR